MRTEVISLGVIDLNRFYGERLKELILSNNGFELLYYAESKRWLNNQLKKKEADIVILVIIESNCDEYIQILERMHEQTGILVITDKRDIDYAVKCFKKGVGGYIFDTTDIAIIPQKIIELKKYGVSICSEIERKLIESMREEKSKTEFTTREEQMIELLLKGYSYLDISKELYIEKSTVKYHLSHLYRKLNVKNKYEAIIKVNNRKSNN